MTEPLSAPPGAAKAAARPEGAAPDDHLYRPISGYAIASACVTAVFALLMAGGFGASWYFGTPFFDLGFLVLVIPGLACVLAAVAFWQIRAAEGTRAGERLAGFSVLASVLIGGIYAANLFATELAVRAQADEAAQQLFFTPLRKGDVASAFWFTLDPARRQSVNPLSEMDLRRFKTGERGGKGEFYQFADSDLARILLQGGPETTIRPLAVKEWKYQGTAYSVLQLYRIESPDGGFEVLLTLRGAENARDFVGRQWNVVWNESPVLKRTLTERGIRRSTVQAAAQLFIDDWLKKVNMGQLTAAFALTRPTAEQPSLLAKAAGDLVQLPEFQSFVQGIIIRADELALPEAARTELLANVRQLFRTPLGRRPSTEFRGVMSGVRPVRSEPNTPERFVLEYTLTLANPAERTPPRVGWVVAVTVEPEPAAPKLAFRLIELSIVRPVDLSRGP